MTDVRPELVFLTGTDAGRREVLASNLIVVGRSASADVQLAEAHASRQHIRLQLTTSGWMMENLSAGGTLVNGRKIKSRRKKVFLATGDVLGFGLQTQVLFVSQGDDPDEAFYAWQQANPLPAVEPELAPAEAPAGAVPAEAEPATAVVEAPAAKARKKTKLVKYLAFGAVYLLGLVGLVVALSSMGEDADHAAAARAQMLSDEQIAQVLSQLPPSRSTTPARAAVELNQALSLYANLPAGPGDLYRCVKSFQLYQTYTPGGAFEDVQHENKYEDALRRLREMVHREYRNAWAYEQAGDWPRSRETWEQLKVALPEAEKGNPVFERLISNIDKHLTYVRSRMRRRRRR